MKYRFELDGRAAGIMRDSWKDSALDAVNSGYAVWKNKYDSIILDDTQGAAIARYPEKMVNR